MERAQIIADGVEVRIHFDRERQNGSSGEVRALIQWQAQLIFNLGVYISMIFQAANSGPC